MRYINLYLVSQHSTNILLSSKTVRKDLKKLNKKGYLKSKILRPVFQVKQLSQIPSYKYIKKKYNINKYYFFLPNQYWIHKNHLMILKCLATIKSNDIKIVSTGIFNDYRNSDHKNKILNFIKKNKLENNYKICGIVPYDDMLSLMAHSIAVINPSKSEGWSSTVEQAKSYGKNVLLSNLPVHLEQNPKRSFFFRTNDINNLSKKLVELNKSFNFKNEIKIVKNELKKNNYKNSIFASSYIRLICSLIK